MAQMPLTREQYYNHLITQLRGVIEDTEDLKVLQYLHMALRRCEMLRAGAPERLVIEVTDDEVRRAVANLGDQQ